MAVIHLVAGTRPNLVKAAAVLDALSNDSRNRADIQFIYTSQHYDRRLYREVIHQLKMPEPDVVFRPPGRNSSVLSSVFDQYTSLLDRRETPSISLVFGDVTSTLAAALAARFHHVPVGHVESGLRSFNWSMPEEINRVAVDSIASVAFATSCEAAARTQGLDNFAGRVFVAGNTMIDTLMRQGFRPGPEGREALLARYSAGEHPMVLCTIHRPANVDNPVRLRELVSLLHELSQECRVVFPVHPRTRRRLNAQNLDLPPGSASRPAGYGDFVKLLSEAAAVVTDSGGVSEEATFLGVPCITLRNETERPETVDLGTNVLVGDDLLQVKELVSAAVTGMWKRSSIPPFWDGKAGQRIVDALIHLGYCS